MVAGEIATVLIIATVLSLVSARAATTSALADRFVWLMQEAAAPPATKRILAALLGP